MDVGRTDEEGLFGEVEWTNGMCRIPYFPESNSKP
jgi:hypothetical protein